MCAEEILEVDVTPVGKVLPHEGTEAAPGGALVLGQVILVGEALVDELGDGVVIAVAALELGGEVEIVLRQGGFDLEPVAQPFAVPVLEEASDVREELDGQGHCRERVTSHGSRGTGTEYVSFLSPPLSLTLSHSCSSLALRLESHQSIAARCRDRCIRYPRSHFVVGWLRSR